MKSRNKVASEYARPRRQEGTRLVNTKNDGSRWSYRSQNSVLCIGSKNSVLSIGSIGSVLSIGSVGSAGSVLSVASFLSAGCLMSGLSLWSVMSWRAKKALAPSAG
jgi:hypothetical protein